MTQNADVTIWSEYQKGNCKIIYDFVDSYLNVPPWNLKGVLRGAAKYFAGQSRYLRLNHWKALQAMCQRADGVACSTEEQKISILPFCNSQDEVKMIVYIKEKNNYAKCCFNESIINVLQSFY